MESNQLTYLYKAKVIKVYDGDTITVFTDLGFNIFLKSKLRLLDIDAPELRGAERESGLKTKEYLSNLILDESITIKTTKFKKGKYGRYLATIFLDGLNINSHLLEMSLVKQY